MRIYKTVEYKFPVKLHAEFKARLKYDEIYMSRFIRACVEAYLEKDPLIMKFVENFKERNNIQNKRIRKKTLKLVERGAEKKKLFNLEKKEIKEIYDILESDIKVDLK